MTRLPGLALALSCLLTSALHAAPELVPGTSTVYQRVLTKHATQRTAAPGGETDARYHAFLPLYVFGRDGDWLQIGASASEPPEGWVRAEETIPWRHNIVGVFSNPANRERQVILDTEEELIRLLNHETLADLLPQLVETADSGSRPEGWEISAVEPAEHIDLDENFYIMPILDFREDFHPLTMDDNLHLQVASLPMVDTEETPDAEDFDVGVVFVVDSTLSMDLYFPLMQQSLRSVVEQVEDVSPEVSARVHFGVVEFRDQGPGIPFNVRTHLPLKRRDSHEAILNALGTLEQSDVSSPGFNEDSFAAIDHALTRIDWAPGGQEFGAKYVILVTDAGPKTPAANPSLYRHNAADLRTEAADKGIGLVALHILTPAGGRMLNHAIARDQYEALTRFQGISAYFDVPGGGAAAFTQKASELSHFIVCSIDRYFELESPCADDDGGDNQEVFETLIGLDAALRLRFLGQARGTEAPTVVQGWVSRQAVLQPRREAISFRLLITRNQLATMADLTEGLIAAAETLSRDADLTAFHSQVRDLIVQMSQNPDRLVNPDASAPGDALEFLSGLPHRSRVLRTSEARWMESAGERREIIDELVSKLSSYQRRLNDPSVWHALFEGAPDGEHVTTLPIQFVP